MTNEAHMTEIKKRAAEILLERRNYRSSLSEFTKKTFALVDPGAVYKHNWHIDCMSEYLMAAYRKEIHRLIINIPPRFMKSISVSVAFPAWVLGHNPKEQIVCASYADKLSIKHSVDTRMVMQSEWYKTLFPKVEIASDQNEKGKFQTTERGHRIAVSVGGGIIGEGGNYLLWDDPMNPKMAASKTIRESTNEWHDQSYSTRMNDPETGVEIGVMQRLHMKDLSGHVLDQEEWTVLDIPMEAEKRRTYSIGNYSHTVEKDELLHADRYNEEAVESLKTRLGSYGYASQCQQRPAPKGGGIVEIDWFQRYVTAPARENIANLRLSLDTAYKEKQINDPSVCEVWGEYNNNHYLLFVWKDRVGYPKLKKTVKNLCDHWKPNEVLIEDKASGQSLIQDLREDTSWAIKPIEPYADKIVRMSNESPTIEAGNIFIPESAPWLFDFEQEVMNFPNAENDDQVDAMSQYLGHVRDPSEIFVG